MPTLRNALVLADKNGRVCLRPTKWNEMYGLLPDKGKKGARWEPALALILEKSESRGRWHEGNRGTLLSDLTGKENHRRPGGGAATGP
jgi:hypothetical protein